MSMPTGKVTCTIPMPWPLIDVTGDNPFMPEGREQPPLLGDRTVFEPRSQEDGGDAAE
jgi:hypothetical protein